MEGREFSVPEGEIGANTPEQAPEIQNAQEGPVGGIKESEKKPEERSYWRKSLGSLEKVEDKYGRGPSNPEVQVTKSEFERNIAEVLKDPDVAHQIALSIKPLEDFVADKKADILSMVSRLEEREKRDELEKSGRPVDRDKELEGMFSRLKDRVSVQKGMVRSVKLIENGFIADFEKLRLASLVGGEELGKAVKDFIDDYSRRYRGVREVIKESEMIDKIFKHDARLRRGSFLEWVRAILEPYPKHPSEVPDRLLLPEWIKYKIERGLTLKRGRDEAREILKTLNFKVPESAGEQSEESKT